VYWDLLGARREAEKKGLPPRHHPVSLESFRTQGIEDVFLAWLLYQGHVEHLRLPARRRGGRTSPYPVASTVLDAESAFVLTPEGAAFASSLPARPRRAIEDAFPTDWERVRLGGLVPRYEAGERVFRWGKHILKRFRQPASNQEIVLMAAEELGWPKWFDDPLPVAPRLNSKVRLHETIKALNRNQCPHLIHFKGDGTGTRVGWGYR
jgi:hypothetical protein